MKTLIAVITLFVGLSASAESPFFNLEKGDMALAPIAGDVQMKVQSPRCPPKALCAPTSSIVITYNLAGCGDSMISTHKKVANADGSYDIYVSAMNVFNERSLVMLCSAMPQQRETIFVGVGFHSLDSVRVHFLGVEEAAPEMD